MISLVLIDHALKTPDSARDLLSVSSNDFKLTCVKDYREILEAFRSNAFDVCLIDSAVDNGLKLFAQARSLGFTAPMVLVTSNNAREALKAIRSGVADCLIRDDLSAASIEHSVCYAVEQARNAALQNQRERRYLALLDNANEIVFTQDLKGNFTSINRVGEQLLGYSQSEILNMNLWQIMAPEYRVLSEKVIARTLDAQTQTGEEVELITRYGCTLPVEINMHPINHDGRTLEIQCIATSPAELPWTSRDLLDDRQPNERRRDNTVTSLQSYEAANISSQKPSPLTDRTIFTF